MLLFRCARRRVDLRDDLVGDLVFDAAHLRGILEQVRLHRDRERFPRMSGIQPHRDRTPRPNPVDPPGSPFYVGRLAGRGEPTGNDEVARSR
jgi:hypothetical protein